MDLSELQKCKIFHKNKLMQITKMQNLSQNELEQIAKTRRIKNYKNMSKEELLISLLKSDQSIAEFCKTKSSNVEIEEIKKNLMR